MNHSLLSRSSVDLFQRSVSAVRESFGEILRGNVFKSFQSESFLNETRRLHGNTMMVLTQHYWAVRTKAIRSDSLTSTASTLSIPQRRKQTEEWREANRIESAWFIECDPRKFPSKRCGFSESGDSPEIRHESEFSINQLLIGGHIEDFTSIPWTLTFSSSLWCESHVCDLYVTCIMRIACLNDLTGCGLHSVDSTLWIQSTR